MIGSLCLAACRINVEFILSLPKESEAGCVYPELDGKKGEKHRITTSKDYR